MTPKSTSLALAGSGMALNASLLSGAGTGKAASAAGLVVV